jgi:hypothetical protein
MGRCRHEERQAIRVRTIDAILDYKFAGSATLKCRVYD